MNWENAKSWLIVAFLVLNLALGWQLYQSRQEMLGYVEPYSDLLANTKTLLAQHDFSLVASVPQDHPDLPSLHASLAVPSLGELTHTVFPTMKHPTIDNTLGTSDTSDGRIKILGEGIWQVMYQIPPSLSDHHLSSVLQSAWHGPDYLPDSATSQDGAMVFLQHYQNYPVFDAELIVQTAPNQILGYTQSAITDIVPVGDPKPIISALDALDSLANAVDKSSQHTDNRILKLDLGYARKAAGGATGQGGSSSYWFPVWRVVTLSQVYYVNALTGEVEVSS